MNSDGGVRRSGIVLAGGRGARFGADKLAADLDGRPVLHGPIEALATICNEVVVVVGSRGVPPLPGGLGVPLRIVRDEVPGAGPLAGLLTGLEEALGSIVVVAAGDMPRLVPALLAELARRAAEEGADAAVLQDGDAIRPLPAAYRRDVALAQARAVRANGASSLRALLDALRVDAMAEADWRRVDPDGMSLVDIDRPADLERIRRVGGAPTS